MDTGTIRDIVSRRASALRGTARLPPRSVQLLVFLLLSVAGIAGILIAAGRGTTTSSSTSHVTGSGVSRTESRSVHDFDQIELLGAGFVRIAQSAREGLRVQADDNILHYIGTSVDNGVLRIEVGRADVTLSPITPITFFINVKKLHGLSISGAADVQLSAMHTDSLALAISGGGRIDLRSLAATSLRVDVNGTGDVVMSGKVETQRVSIAGVGSYAGDNLDSAEATVSIAGAGSATVQVRDALDVTIEGTGSVNYIGDPQVHQNINGVGTVTRVRA